MRTNHNRRSHHHTITCSFCGQRRLALDITGADGRFRICSRCTAAFDALRDGIADALAILRQGEATR